MICLQTDTIKYFTGGKYFATKNCSFDRKGFFPPEFDLPKLFQKFSFVGYFRSGKTKIPGLIKLPRSSASILIFEANS